jgi:hypothetical protein
MNKLNSSLRNLRKQTEPKQIYLSGTLGVALGGQEIVDVPGRPGFVYVQLLNNLSELIQAYNGTVASIYGLPILVQRNGDRYDVTGRDTLRYQNWGNTPYLPIHGNTHSFNTASGGGGDLVWVHQEQFYPLAVTPSGTYESPNVIVAPYLYNWYGAWHYYAGGGAPDCALAHPTGSSSTQVLLLCLEGDAGTLHYITGSVEAPHLITGSAGLFPHLPSYDPDTDIPLAAICITTGTTTIGWEEIYDVRQFFGREQTGGGTGSVSNHNSLTGLDGGTPGEYYHLTHTQYDDLTDGGETILHHHSGTSSGATVTHATAAQLLMADTKILLHCEGSHGSTLVKNSTGENDFTCYGDAIISTGSCKFGTSSLYFNGAGNIISCGVINEISVGTGDFTLEMWVKDTAGGDNWIWDSRRATDPLNDPDGFGLYLNAGHLTFWNFSTGDVAGTTDFTTNIWHHIAVSRRNGYVSLFLDGALEATSNVLTPLVSYTPIYIGRYSGSAAGYLTGYFDEIRFVAGQAIYTGAFTPPVAQLPDAATQIFQDPTDNSLFYV